MLGTFQQSSLRIELSASQATLEQALRYPANLRCWLFPAQLSGNLTERFEPGQRLTTWLGPVPIQQTVDQSTPISLRLLLSQGIDGFHEWSWGDGWVQSRLEGFSLLPLNLMQTGTLWQLKQYLAKQVAKA